MKLTLLGSLGNINRILVPKLIKAGHEVTIITTKNDRISSIENLGATAAVGTMEDVKFLTEQFSNRDAVYLMISGTPSEDLFLAAKSQGEIFKHAITDAKVKNIVNLSSIGADAGKEAGSLYAYNLIENELRQLENINIAFVRPVGFYNNLYSHLSTVKNEHAIYSNIPKSIKGAWVYPSDIAETILPLLLDVPKGHTVHYAIVDVFSGEEFTEKLREVLKMDDLSYIEISDNQFKQALKSRKIPEKIIDAFIQMNEYQRHPEKIYADLEKHKPQYGKVKLDDFAQIFAKALNDTSKNNSKAQTIISER